MGIRDGILWLLWQKVFQKQERLRSRRQGDGGGRQLPERLADGDSVVHPVSDGWLHRAELGLAIVLKDDLGVTGYADPPAPGSSDERRSTEGIFRMSASQGCFAQDGGSCAASYVARDWGRAMRAFAHPAKPGFLLLDTISRWRTASDRGIHVGLGERFLRGIFR